MNQISALKHPGSEKLVEFLKVLFSTGIKAVGILLIYAFFDKGFRYFGYLPEGSYFESIIARGLVKNILNQLPLVLLIPSLIVLATIVLLAFKSNLVKLRLIAISHSWKQLPLEKSLYRLFLLGAFFLVWSGSTYDYNLYFNQMHLFDRLLLIVLFLLLCKWPIFVFPFTLLFITIFAQFETPFGVNPGISEVNFFVRLLLLVGATFLFYVLTGKMETRVLLLLVICLLASMYWGSGLGKIKLNWISHPYVHWLLPGAYSGGWLAHLPAEAIVKWTKTLAVFIYPLMIFTLFVEWGALFILFKRRLFYILVIGFIIFHFGVFATTGMFFWKWIIFEVALLLYFLKHKDAEETALFNPAFLVLSLVIIGFSNKWYQPRNLSWYDTPLSYTYRIEAIGESGQRYSLAASAFSPYGDMFMLGTFDYLNPHYQLTGLWDITSNRSVADSLVRVKDEAEVFRLEPEMGSIRYDSAHSLVFDRFMTTFAKNWNKRGSKKSWVNVLGPPCHLCTMRRENPYNGNENIARIEVYQMTSLYDGNQYKNIRKRLVRDLEIIPERKN